MSIPSSRAAAPLLNVAGIAILTMAPGLACKKNESPAEPSVTSAGSAMAAAAAQAAPSNRPGALGKGIIQGSVHFSGKALPAPIAAGLRGGWAGWARS